MLTSMRLPGSDFFRSLACGTARRVLPGRTTMATGFVGEDFFAPGFFMGAPFRAEGKSAAGVYTLVRVSDSVAADALAAVSLKGSIERPLRNITMLLFVRPERCVGNPRSELC